MLFHHVGELGEEVVGVVRAWGSFGVVLHAEEGEFFVAHALVSVVVEIDVGDLDFAGGQGIGIHAEAMILRGDFHFFGEKIFDRMIRTVMAEFEFESFAAKSQAAELMAETDAEDGNAAEEFADVFDGVADGLRVAGSVREEDAVGPHVENVLRGGLRRNDPGFAMMVGEETEDVLLDAEVVGHNAEAAAFGNAAGVGGGLGPGRKSQFDGRFFPAIGLGAGDVAGEFLAGHAGELLGFEDELVAGSAVGGDNAAKGANIANVAYEGARVNVPDDGNLVTVEIKLSGFGGAPVGGELRKFADDKRFDVRMGRFFVLEIGTDIADVRVSEADDLAGVAGVGENFLVAREAGIENDFTAAAGDGASGAAIKNAAIFESESGRAVGNFGQLVLPR